MSLVIVLIAIAGAFASNLSNGESALTDKKGRYLTEDQECLESETTCSTVFNTVMCSDIIHGPLFDWNGTICTTQLYKPQ